MRTKNIILHGVKEDASHNKDEIKTADDQYVSNLVTTLGIQVEERVAIRIGEKKENRNRPIKLVLKSEHDKENIMSSLRKLKGLDDYKGLSITEDYTPAERRLNQEWAKKAS